jgi:hypothetical protein
MGQSHFRETNNYWSRNLFLPWNPKVHHRVHNSQPLFYISSRWIQSTASNPVSLRLILILSSHLLMCLQSGLFSLSFPTNCPYPLSLDPMRTTCPTNLTILLSHLHLAKIINYEALCWAYFYTTLLLHPCSVRQLHCCSFTCGAIASYSILFPLVPHIAEGGNGIFFTLWSLNEGQIRSRVGGGVNKKTREYWQKEPCKGQKIFSSPKKVHTVFGAHLATYLMDTAVLSRG